MSLLVLPSALATRVLNASIAAAFQSAIDKPSSVADPCSVTSSVGSSATHTPEPSWSAWGQ
eukprot:1423866-Rhodomonas_salina.1